MCFSHMYYCNLHCVCQLSIHKLMYGCKHYNYEKPFLGKHFDIYRYLYCFGKYQNNTFIR
jgi:hypothetical protein